MQPVKPILVTELFPALNAELLPLLRGLSQADWDRPTACALWSVHDIVAHLLDGNIKRLSVQRDAHRLPQPETPLTSYEDLATFIHYLNAEWVQTARRMSAPVLIALLELTNEQIDQFFATLDLEAPARFSVAWAGEVQSPNWFDLAREYTEKWVQQQQIREAVGRSGLTSRMWLFPVLDTFMRALPYTYRDVEAGDGVSLSCTITGEAGSEWSLLRQDQAWRLFAGKSPSASAHVHLSQDTAWRLFTQCLSPEDARARVQVEGDHTLGTRILDMVSIMA